MSSIATALREAADLLDAHPDLPNPYVTTSFPGAVHLAWYLTVHMAGDLAAQKQTAARIIGIIGGKWDKDPGEGFNFRSTRRLLEFTVQVNREAVCTRRVIGTEKVEHPAVEAREAWTEEREVVMWDCQPVLAEAVPA